MNAEQLSRVGEKLVKRCGSRDPFEIAESHGNQKCLLMLEENEEWGLRFLDCGTYYIFLEKDFCRRLEEAT